MVTGSQSLTTNDIKIEIKSNEEMQQMDIPQRQSNEKKKEMNMNMDNK